MTAEASAWPRIRPIVALTAAALVGTSLAAPPGRPDESEAVAPGVPGTPFSDGGSWIYHYVSKPAPYTYADRTWDYDPTPYSRITARLTDGYYTNRGITNLMVYAPYHSTGEFRGLPAIDYFDSSPENGSIEDFRTMAAAANARGITVTMYIALLYVSPLNDLFVKAQADRRDDVESPERSMFRWDERDPQGSEPPPSLGGTGSPPPDSAPNVRPDQGDWAFSTVAGRWYATSWGFPALDFASAVAREYAKDVLRFWMDLGVQGFEYDFSPSYWGMQGVDEPRQTEIQVTAPREHRPDLELFLHAEGIGSFAEMEYSDRVGYTHVLINGDDDFDSFASRVGRTPQTLSVDQLEDHWRTWFDSRQAGGRGVYAWSLYDDDIDPRLRALDAAVQAGMGAQYSIDYEQLVDNPRGGVIPESALELTWDVHRALRNSPALAPAATRVRIPTQDDPHLYAILRRSADRSRTALNLYNFAAVEKCLTVNLAGSGVTVPQRTTDLATMKQGPWVRSTEESFRLPPYGWLFLDVEAGPGFPWTVIDDADDGWTVAGGWTSIADPSAYRGSRIGGNTRDAFAEIAFNGVSVQGWGRKSTSGAEAVEVLIDGVSHGVHSQRRSAPVGPDGGTVFHGQLLFSITGLSAGPHRLRIQHVAPSGATDSQTDQHSGIDYLRVSDERYEPPGEVAGGDPCD